MGDRRREPAQAVVKRYGRTYAEDAGIRLVDRPAPLYQLLVLATLLSARISAGVAVAAARELFAAGLRTAKAMHEASWQDRVDALGRGHYRRYDERTAKMLGDGGELCLSRWRGDLRRLHREAGRDVRELRRLLTEFPGIGPTGADIFLREAQAVWTDPGPVSWISVERGEVQETGPSALRGPQGGRRAKRLDLPASAEGLSRLVGRDEVSRLASGLVRVSIDRKAAADLTGRS